MMYEEPKIDIVKIQDDVIRTSDSKPLPKPNPDDGEIDWA